MRYTSRLLPLSFIIASLTAGCGGGGGAAPATPAAAPAASTESPPVVASSDEPKAEAPKADSSGKTGLTEEKLHAAKSLETFPEIDAVTKEIGAPFESGKAARLEWYFDKSGTGKSLHCSTVDVIKGPGGKAVFHDSVYTGPECGAVKATKSALLEALAQLGSEEKSNVGTALSDVLAKRKSFEEVSAAFEKKLGKPVLKGEPPYAAWKYTNGQDTCSILVVTHHLGSNAGHAIFDIPCQ